MDLHSVADVGGLQKTLRGAIDEVGGVGGERRVVAGELDSGGRLFEGKAISERDGMEKGFEFVKAVWAFAQDVEEKINFAGGETFEGHALKRKAPVPCGMALLEKRWLSNRRSQSGCPARAGRCRHRQNQDGYPDPSLGR